MERVRGDAACCTSCWARGCKNNLAIIWGCSSPSHPNQRPHPFSPSAKGKPVVAPAGVRSRQVLDLCRCVEGVFWFFCMKRKQIPWLDPPAVWLEEPGEVGMDLTMCPSCEVHAAQCPSHSPAHPQSCPSLQGATPGLPVLTCGPKLKPMGWNIPPCKARRVHQPAGTRGRNSTNQVDTKFPYNLINIIVFCSKRCTSKNFLTCGITNSLDY